jgi:quercetin 2,3-dioxygenase
MLNLIEIEPEIYIHLAQKRQEGKNTFITHGIHQEIHDVLLEPFEQFIFQKKPNESVLILPFIGDITLNTENYDMVIEENKGLFLRNLRNTSFQIQNTYEADSVNFFYIPISENQVLAPFDSVFIHIERHINNWHAVGSGIYISQWTGRAKGTFTSYLKKNVSLFVFCISGVFEVNERLLEQKDSLEIINGNSINFEALAVDSVLLIIEKHT